MRMRKKDKERAYKINLKNKKFLLARITFYAFVCILHLYIQSIELCFLKANVQVRNSKLFSCARGL